MSDIILASYKFEGLDELIDALEALRDFDTDTFLGVEGNFAIMGYAVLTDFGDGVHVVVITDKSTDEIVAKDLSA